MSKGNNFIERSLVGALSFLRDSVFSDEHAAKNGLMQSLGPRVKVAAVFSAVVGVLLVKDILIVISFYFLCLLLAVFSRIRPGFFLKRTWFFIPLFSLFIAVPAIFSVFTPGEALTSIKIFGFKLIITRQGLNGATLFLARVITSVSFVVLLSITTRHFELLKALRAFGVPQIFVMTLGMCYRYIYLFAGLIENTYKAIKSRVGGKLHYKKGQHIVAWNIAYLWKRSYQLNEDVYNAMLSRGFSGEARVLDE